MMFLEEIWSRNFTNLFIAPIKINEIIASLTLTAIFRTLIGLVPATILAIPLFGVSIFKLGIPLLFLLLSLYIFGITLGVLVTSGLLRFGPSFESIAWASLFFLAPLGCIYYPIEILPHSLQLIAKALPLVHIFEEMRNILLNNSVSWFQIIKSISISMMYFVFGVIVFYVSYFGAKVRGTLINMGE
jgi:ABC-2 type transport system permease protein